MPTEQLRIFATSVAVAAALSALTSAMAQTIEKNPDWKEVDVPPPPAFSNDRLIPVDMPAFVTLKFGVDPATLTVTSDGVVRYVMVAANASGASNAMYEGIRCSTGEFKTYARFSAAGQWSLVNDPQWRPLRDNNTSKHALALARQGACEGRSAAANNPAQIIAMLKNSPRNSGR